MSHILFKDKKGYTVIELIFVFAIMAIAITIVFANYRNNSTQIALQRSAYRLMGDIRKAQGMAGIDAGCSSDYNYGYGIYFDLSSSNARKVYKLYADCDNNKIYSGDASGELKETVNIEAGVQIGSLQIGTGGSKTTADILFMPPDPFTLIDGLRDSSNPLDVSFRLDKDFLKIKKVSINRAGMVSIVQ